MNKIEKWKEEFDYLDENDRLIYIIDLAKYVTSLPKKLRTEDRLVRGCISKIWIDVGVVDNLVKVYYDSDAMITKGIARVICDCFTDSDKDEATTVGIDDFNPLGIQPLLTAQRRNGLGNLIHTVVNKCKKL